MAIVGQDRGDFVRRDIDQRAQEGGRSLPIGFADQLGMSEFGCPVDGHKKIEFSFLGSDLGDVEMEEADRVDLEPASLGLVTFDIGQPADRMALQAAMQMG